MKKIAVFVEGMTEQELVVWMIHSIAGAKGLQIVYGRQFKGKVQITATAPDPNTEFYVLVVDCSHDEQVKTQIREQYATLVASGYTEIVGLRDVYPADANEIAEIAAKIMDGVPVNPVVPTIHLALMEVEAWFIGEMTHFARLSPALSIPRIEQGGFPISTTPAESWNHPASTLHAIYKLENIAYRKTKSHVRRTISALCFSEISTNVRQSVPALNGFLGTIEQALV